MGCCVSRKEPESASYKKLGESAHNKFADARDEARSYFMSKYKEIQFDLVFEELQGLNEKMGFPELYPSQKKKLSKTHGGKKNLPLLDFLQAYEEALSDLNKYRTENEFLNAHTNLINIK